MPTFVSDLVSSLPQPWRSLVVPLSVFLTLAALGLLIRYILFAKARQWVKDSGTRETLFEVLHGAILVWFFIFAISVATDSSDLPSRYAILVKHALQVLWILSFTMVASRFGRRMLQVYGARKDGPPQSGTLSEVLINVVVGAIGGLMLLRALGFDITTVLTAFGVGGLAVALALQDTLSNFFAGFYVSLAGQVRIGDFVKLDSGQQGYVTDIGWRSTILSDLNNNLIIIPNNKLGQSIVTNYYFPERRSVANVIVNVSYDADLKKAEQVLRDVIARLAQSEKALLKTPESTVLLTGLNAMGAEFTLACQVATYEDLLGVQHEIRMAIVTNLRAAGIAISHPAKAVELAEAGPASKVGN